jgi:beta-1,4-N-acetylglucosaminyltransferase
MVHLTAVLTVLAIVITLLIIATTHLLSILPPRRAKPLKRIRAPTQDTGADEPEKGHLMIVLGSGGHTAEMLLMLTTINLEEFKRRTWVCSDGDGFSAGRADEVEKRIGTGVWDVVTIPRARKVHQSLLTTPVSSLYCLWACLALLRRHPPDIILTNGPGTGVIVVLASVILRFFSFTMLGDGADKTRIIYVESLARVKKLSLSGRLLRTVVDRFIVQWEGLKGMGEWTGGSFVLDAAVVDSRVKRNDVVEVVREVVEI